MTALVVSAQRPGRARREWEGHRRPRPSVSMPSDKVVMVASSRGIEGELLHAKSMSQLACLRFVVSVPFGNEDGQIAGFVLDVDRSWLKLQAEHTLWLNLNYIAAVALLEDELAS